MAKVLKVAVMALFLCSLCFGEDKRNPLGLTPPKFMKDNPMCKELVEKGVILEYLEMPWVGIESDTREECVCVETITCGKKEYCVLTKCPNVKELISTFKTSEAALLPDH